MLAVLEVGNTHTILALLDGDTIWRQWRLVTDRERTADEYGIQLRSLLAGVETTPEVIEGIALASVVPAVGDTLVQAAESHLGRPITRIRNADDLGIANLCDPPDAVGIDRLLNAFAAHSLFGGPAIIIDLGTATTFDAVNADGEFLGGAIAPGMRTSAEALWSAAPRLPRVELNAPPRAIARNTTEALQSGIVLGYGQFMDGMIQQMRLELEGRPKIIATGGLASVLNGISRFIDRYEPDLTLRGIHLAYARLQQTRA